MITITTSYYPQVLLLVLARVSGVLWVLQRLGSSRISPSFQIAMALVVTMGLLPMVPQSWMAGVAELNSIGMVLFAMGQEIAVGACLGFAVDLIFAATGVAGVLIGMSSSLMMAQSLDPASGQQSGISRQVLMSCLVIFLLLTNTHLEMIRILGHSFTALPVMAAWDMKSVSGMIVDLGRLCFEWGLRLAMPIVCASLILNACLGLITKLAPNFNVLFLSLPVRLFAGVALLGLVIHSIATSYGILREKILMVFGRLLLG